MTTDTTDAPSHAAKRGGAEPEAAEVSTKSAEKAEQEEQQEGILSSDEEGVAEKKPTNYKVVVDKPLMSGQHEVRSFESEGASKALFESDKVKEEVENRFNFGEQDLEYFGARLQQKAERETGTAAEIAKDDDEDRDYVAKTQYQQEEMDKIDMHALNLFGVPLEDTSGKDLFKDVAGSNKET